MTKEIDINGKVYEQIIYKDEPVVTFPMLEKLHGRSHESIRTNFQRNKERFFDGKDFFQLPYEEWKEVLNPTKSWVQTGENDHLKGTKCPLQDGSESENSASSNHGGRRGHMIFLTQFGYLKLIKTFNDDLAWDIYIQVVEFYFFSRVAMGSRRQPNPEYIAWLKEQRMSMCEERRFQEFALSETDRLFRTGGKVASLSHVPMLQDAVRAIMRTDPRSKQIGMFEE